MAAPPFQHLKSHTHRDVLVLTLTSPEIGSDDLADAVRREVLTACTGAGCKKVALDFQHVHYLASPGIRFLLAVRRHFQETGGRLVLCSLQPLIADVLNTARLINTGGSTPPCLFETAADLSAGMAHLGA
jgi:anti-anti-sigma factor